MLGGVFYTSCVYGRHDDQASSSGQKVAIEVAGVPIFADAVENQVEAQKQSPQAQFGGSSPEQDLSFYQTAVKQLVDSSSKVTLVKQSGIPVTDDALLKAFHETVDAQLDSMRSSMVASGQLKPDATDAQFSDAFKKTSGKTPDEAKKDAEKSIKQALGDSEQRKGVELSLAGVLLLDQAIAKLNLTDADVLKSYDQYTVKRIIAKDIVPGKTSPDDRIGKAQAALKSGTDFDKAIALYSEDLPNGNKKLSDTTLTLQGSSLVSDPEMKPLLALKPGDVSGVIKVPDGKAIYKVISIKSDPPKDYAKRKDVYRRQLAEEMSQKGVQDQVDKYTATPGNVKFVSPALKAIFDLQQAQSGAADPSGKSLTEKMQAIYNSAKAITGGGAFEMKAALLARYGAINFLWRNDTAHKDKQRPEFIDTLKAILDRTESVAVRTSLAEAYADAKQGDDATSQLVQAAQYNKTDFIGQMADQQITTTLTKLVKDKQLTPEQQKKVEAAQAEWKKNFDAKMKEQAEIAKEKKAAQDAEAAKAKAEADAKAKQNPPKGPLAPPATTGTTAATTGTATGTTATTAGTATTGTTGAPATGAPANGAPKPGDKDEKGNAPAGTPKK